MVVIEVEGRCGRLGYRLFYFGNCINGFFLFSVVGYIRNIED